MWDRWGGRGSSDIQLLAKADEAERDEERKLNGPRWNFPRSVLADRVIYINSLLGRRGRIGL